MKNLFTYFDEFVVNESETVSRQIRFYNNKIDVMKEWRERTIRLVLYKDKHLLSMILENPRGTELKRAIDRAKTILPQLSPSPFSLGAATRYKNRKIVDIDVIDEEHMIDTAEDAISRGLSHGNEVAGVCYGSVIRDKIMTSTGAECEDINSMGNLSTRIFDKLTSIHAVSCGRSHADINTLSIENTSHIKEGITYMKRAVPGTYDVIFAPMACANLMAHVADFASAFAVSAGYSFMNQQLGKQIASPLLTLRDSGIKKDGMFSRKYDEEGAATTETTIIENGILKTFLHNGTTAQAYGTLTTGNAGIPAPGSWNTIIEKGDAALEEMIANVKNGLLITNVWYTRFQNYRNGDFSTVARDVAIRIKNGEFTHGVKGVRISDNIERMITSIAMLSSDAPQIYWWEVEHPVFCPNALIEKVRISTT